MSKSQKKSPEVWMWKDLAADHSPLLTINPAQLDRATTPVTSTSSSELVSSYNWLKGDKLAIVAPGFAPTWKPPPMPTTVPPDNGTFSIDPNGARMSRFPFEPLFRAATIVSPGFRFDEVDIVINRNSLRKLLDLCRGRVEAGFRLELLQVGNTLVVQRCERKVREKLRGGKYGTQRCWGHNFEKSCVHFPPDTGCGNSVSHHRALRYKIGDLNCVVQFEVDASYEEEDKLNEAGNRGDDLSALDLSQLSIADNGGPASPAVTAVPAAGPTGSLLATHRAGCLQPQTSMAEIKSTIKHKTGGISKHMPQLWFGRTPWLLVGHQTDGSFSNVSITHAAARFSAWDADDTNQAALRTLVALLARLRNDVLQRLSSNPGIGPGYAVAICEKQSKPRTIQIFAPSKGKKQALPDDLIRYFWSSPA